MRAKRYLVTRGPIVGVMHARVRHTRARGVIHPLSIPRHSMSLQSFSQDGTERGDRRGCIYPCRCGASTTSPQARFTRNISRDEKIRDRSDKCKTLVVYLVKCKSRF